MAHCEQATKPLLQCLRSTYARSLPGLHVQARGFQSSAANAEAETEQKKTPFRLNPDPELVTQRTLENQLMRKGTPPIGSRRRRAALRFTPNTPFEQLPYQCFQEARNVLLADRAEKLKEIDTMRQRIANVEAQSTEGDVTEQAKKSRVRAMQLHLERLKIHADINDPLVKRKFEDGQGDMSKPIYRFLADRKWREYRRKILVQRITQMKVIPDVLPHCDPILDTKLYFNKKQVQPGDFVEAQTSTTAPKLDVQLFESGEKLVTIAIIDSDVPNVETDSFDYKMHYLAVNVPISATATKVDLSQLAADSQVVLPWLPPVAQKGSPYHRLSILIMEQKDSQLLDFAAVKAKETNRDNMLLRTLQARYHLKAIGAHLFRTQWDDTTLDVMKQIGYNRADVELRRKKVEPLPYKRRNPSTFR
ncbi:hypothetical protein N7462_004515 [Penicillium macrosclerotiorum]|uniref:uncharacterized protein n=1 Tax=Penicillium macrosclerotiorum TaxID=303699 RepID=UPI002547D363|nr:uncharacterized protein N7462_004515 [Penicillium macrosclerotiorum]KAJ5690123.1 hypothetical protein N7462_004515 [Penicillium macrosclerotiorum]